MLANKDKNKENLLVNLEKIEQKRIRLNDLLTKELENLNPENKCSKLRLVKTYTSRDEMELDNNREIFIEDDKLIEGEVDNRVKIGHYAILIENMDKKKIFKRVRLADSKEMWVLETDLHIDLIINSYKDFCLQQGLSMNEIDTKFFKVNKS